ncbi:hypothetical protein A3A79_04480 [Candidatus Gottesmanbacteria bacterium RIFCSPLOWO2_01_FULL_43_11b]|uniref:Uncharacterized protein n=1 Tax=Candidatus Gottesmanbacteria bacterium RIFCSPLOWO2_01_FULL_43_11b TaxID=1798392 RepID=A0A1F6AIZ1_9BACT|nr:MAG: hypothetical protein A3A79_04480 [Candidatus Gottesmanbacteria bacterium RIFCSPLOWO2_01_FULL_43_11b]
MTNLGELEKEIESIKARNHRVEADKAWETSWTRRIFIGVSTYLLIAIFLIIIKAEHPFETAIIPSVAYIISTLSLGLLKSRWLKKRIDFR